MQRIAFLGPEGTFGHEAAKTWLLKAEHIPYSSHLKILEAVERREVPLGVVGVENSVAGPVLDVQDYFIHDANAIRVLGEVVLAINQCAWIKLGTDPDAVRVVLSHPTGLEQCAKNIRRMFPNAELKKTDSTAEAVREMLAMSVPAVAIAGKAAAQDGAVVLQENVQDRQRNSTRFWVVGCRSARLTGCDRTSLVFELYENAPGALIAILALFASRGLNLSKVESRPNKEALGRYVFLVDVEAHEKDEHLRDTLRKVRACTPRMRVFGSYPRWQNGV